MADPTRRDGAGVATGNVSSFSATIPATTTVGDHIIVCLMYANSTGANIPTFAGYTALGVTDLSATFSVKTFYKVAEASDAGSVISFTWSALQKAAASIEVWSNVDSVVDYAATPYTVAGTNFPGPTVDDAQGVVPLTFYGNRATDPPAPTVPTGWTAGASAANIGGGATNCFAAYNAKASSYSGYEWTAPSAAAVLVASLGLRAQATGGGAPGTFGDTLTYSMNRVAGTLVNGRPVLGAQGAANVWAGTSGLGLVGALNAKNGTKGLGIQGVLNALAGTTGLGIAEAARRIEA